MIRAAAKNHAFVTVATDPDRSTPRFLEAVAARGGTTPGTAATAGAGRLCPHRRPTTRRSPPTCEGQVAAERISRRRWRFRPAARRCCAMARIRINGRPFTPSATPAARAWYQPSNWPARSCRTTTCWTWTARWPSSAPLAGPAVSVIKHNNPCGAAVADTLVAAARQPLDWAIR